MYKDAAGFERYDKVCVFFKVSNLSWVNFIKFIQSKNQNETLEIFSIKCTTAPDGAPYKSSNSKSDRLIKFPVNSDAEVKEIDITFSGGQPAHPALFEIEG